MISNLATSKRKEINSHVSEQCTIIMPAWFHQYVKESPATDKTLDRGVAEHSPLSAWPAHSLGTYLDPIRCDAGPAEATTVQDLTCDKIMYATRPLQDLNA